jgi:hypothetical protein
MERLLLKTWIFVVAFCFGLSVSAAWRIYTLPVIPDLDIPPVGEATAEAPAKASDELRIVEGTHRCGALADGQVYELSDGGRISIKCTMFGSPASATRELMSRSEKATTEGRLLTSDNEGGEVLIFAPQVQRLRTDGRSLCVTEASSLLHLRWFERQGR